MKFCTMLQESHIIPRGRAATPRDAVVQLLGLLAADGSLPDPERALVSIMERESAYPTGIGGGVAIPHTNTLPLADSLVAAGTFSPGVDFGASDGPARLIILLLSPPGNSGAHLKLLARISRLARHDIADQLRDCPDAEAFIKTIATVEQDFLEL